MSCSMVTNKTHAISFFPKLDFSTNAFFFVCCWISFGFFEAEGSNCLSGISVQKVRAEMIASFVPSNEFEDSTIAAMNIRSPPSTGGTTAAEQFDTARKIHNFEEATSSFIQEELNVILLREYIEQQIISIHVAVTDQWYEAEMSSVSSSSYSNNNSSSITSGNPNKENSMKSRLKKVSSIIIVTYVSSNGNNEETSYIDLPLLLSSTFVPSEKSHTYLQFLQEHNAVDDYIVDIMSFIQPVSVDSNDGDDEFSQFYFEIKSSSSTQVDGNDVDSIYLGFIVFLALAVLMLGAALAFMSQCFSLTSSNIDDEMSFYDCRIGKTTDVAQKPFSTVPSPLLGEMSSYYCGSSQGDNSQISSEETPISMIESDTSKDGSAAVNFQLNRHCVNLPQFLSPSGGSSILSSSPSVSSSRASTLSSGHGLAMLGTLSVASGASKRCS
mmetsp:Transcript_58359/g.70247  ORF Transcript_58359/g.70247 Transcript_58359/m.70247 type:complete len:440 (+) Transcript_58359:112-1431(+)